MSKFLAEIEKDFRLFQSPAYALKLKNLSDDLSLRPGFDSAYLPAYFAGDIDSQNKIIIIGINPGAIKNNLDYEASQISKSFNSYINFYKNFFILQKKGPAIKYYAYLRSCLDIEPNPGEHYWDYCNKNIVNIDLIPYHSNSFKMTLNDRTRKIYYDYFTSILEFIKSRRDLVKYIIIHKNKLATLLLEKGFIQQSDKLALNLKPGRDVYFKIIDGIKFLIFSRFIPNGGFRVEDIHNLLKTCRLEENQIER